MKSSETFLYRHFDKGGGLLYVGISLSAVTRLSQHSAGSPWFSEICRVEVEKYRSRHAAERAEMEAISSEHPKYNKRHNNGAITAETFFLSPPAGGSYPAVAAPMSPRTALFYRLRGLEWREAGLPGVTMAYQLHAAGKLALVKDAAGRTGVTAAEATRYFSDVRPLSAATKRDIGKAVAGRQARRRVA